MLPQAPATSISASLLGPGGAETTADGGLCLVDEFTYFSSDTVYGPTGEDILQSDNAVILIPRSPLVTGASRRPFSRQARRTSPGRSPRRRPRAKTEAAELAARAETQAAAARGM